MTTAARRFGLVLAAATLAFAAGIAPPAAAQVATPNPFDGNIRGLKLGLSATAMPPGFINFACGSNGAPPLQKIKGFADFKTCKPESHGLYEVAFEYDNIGDRIVDMFVEDFGAAEGGLWLDRYVGTKVAGHPVVLSVLFDDAGIVQGIRAVTDSRARLDQRRISNIMAVLLRNQYDPANWTCQTLPLAAGEQPIGNSYVKERCETVYRNDRRMITLRNFFRKAGQTGANDLGQFVDGDFESSARWEVWSLSVSIN